VQEMSYWAFSDVFEEQGVVKTPFYGGYGLLAVGGIPKPAFNAFLLLHRLGDQRLAVSSDDVLVTKRADGSLTIAAWNLTPVGEKAAAKQIDLQFRNSPSGTVYVSRVDADHGDVHKTYEAMGSPRYPTKAQIAILQAASTLPASEIQHLSMGSLKLTIPSQGLVLIETEPGR